MVFCLFPVHNIPKICNIICSLVLMLEVICMLPNIDSDNRSLSIDDRTILKRCPTCHQCPIYIFDKPSPSRSKCGHSFFGEFFFEWFNASKRLIESIGKFSHRNSSKIRSQNIPEEGVIHMSSNIIDNSLPDFYRNFIEVLENLYRSIVQQRRSF